MNPAAVPLPDLSHRPPCRTAYLYLTLYPPLSVYCLPVPHTAPSPQHVLPTCTSHCTPPLSVACRSTMWASLRRAHSSSAMMSPSIRATQRSRYGQLWVGVFVDVMPGHLPQSYCLMQYSSPVPPLPDHTSALGYSHPEPVTGPSYVRHNLLGPIRHERSSSRCGPVWTCVDMCGLGSVALQ